MLTRTQKEAQVAELKDKFGRATSVYVADYRGLDVESANALRRRIRTEGGGDFEYRVAKNSVLKLASVGLFVGVVGATFGSRVLENFLFEVPSTDTVTFVTVGSAMVAVSILAALVPAVRAARRRPAELLGAD